MSEIEKMYENAGIEPDINYVCDKEPCEKHSVDCQECSHLYAMREDYPDFTAEKQMAIENIIFQCNFGVCELQRTMPAEFTKENRFVKHYFSWEYYASDIGYYNEITEEPYGDWDVEYSNPSREEALAGFVNALWDEHLTPEEKQQVKGILE